MRPGPQCNSRELGTQNAQRPWPPKGVRRPLVHQRSGASSEPRGARRACSFRAMPTLLGISVAPLFSFASAAVGSCQQQNSQHGKLGSRLASSIGESTPSDSFHRLTRAGRREPHRRCVLARVPRYAPVFPPAADDGALAYGNVAATCVMMVAGLWTKDGQMAPLLPRILDRRTTVDAATWAGALL